jgi:hypothetical protein
MSANTTPTRAHLKTPKAAAIAGIRIFSPYGPNILAASALHPG